MAQQGYKHRLIIGKNKRRFEGLHPFAIPAVGEYVMITSVKRKRVKEVVHSYVEENDPSWTDERFPQPKIIVFQAEIILED